MSEPTITCPSCKTEFKLNESLAAPLIESTRKQFEKQMAQKDADIAQREKAARDKEKQLDDAKKAMDEQISDQVQEQLAKDKAKITIEAEKKAKLAAATELQEKSLAIVEMQEVLNQNNQKLAEAQKAQVALIKKERELEDARREVELTIQKGIQENLEAARQQAKKEGAEEQKFKVMEAEQKIEGMQKTIEELKRKSEQGSQQLQGEVQELELENLLKAKFLFDSIEPVPKGEHGGDILHRVSSSAGQVSGTILWESKRTKNWSDGWLSKLREDQRAAKAELAVIISQVLPKGVETFDLIEGVWVVHPRSALPVAMILRQTLLEVALARSSSEGQQTKTEMIYQYLTGPRFKQRVEAIVEAFSTMQEDLTAEKKAIQRQWAKREIQIDNVMQSTVGMYGDLQGIAGKSLQEIEGLELPSLGFDAKNKLE